MTKEKIDIKEKIQREIERKAERIISNSSISNGIVNVKLNEIFGQIDNTSTVTTLKVVIDKSLEKGLNKFLLCLDGMYISDAAFNALVKLVGAFNGRALIKMTVSDSEVGRFESFLGPNFNKIDNAAIKLTAATTTSGGASNLSNEEKLKLKRQKEIERYTDRIYDYAKVGKLGVVTILLNSTFDQITSSVTIDALKNVIEDTIAENLNKFILNLSGVYVADSAFDALVKMYNDIGSKAVIKFKVDNDNNAKYAKAFGENYNKFSTDEIKSTTAKAEKVDAVAENTNASSSDADENSNMTAAERKLKANIQKIKETLVTEGRGIPILEIFRKYDSISSNNTIYYIVETIKQLNGISKLIIDFTNVALTDDVIVSLKKYLEGVDKEIRFSVNSKEDKFKEILGEGFNTFHKKAVHYNIDELPVVSAHDITNVDTLSEGNNRSWTKLLDYLEAHNVPTNFDFKGMEIRRPLDSEVFKKLLGMENFYMTIYYNEPLVNAINAACRLNGSLPKVKNIKIEVAHVETKEEKRAKASMERLLKSTMPMGDKYTICIGATYSAIGGSSMSTISGIKLLIEKIIREHPEVKEIILDFGSINIEEHLIGPIVNIVKTYTSDKVDVAYISNDPEVERKMDIEWTVGNTQKTQVEKANIIKSNISEGTAGILVIYKQSRKRDRYGRSGDGEVARADPAIFRGIYKDGDDDYIVKLTRYSTKRFYTMDDWALQHDNELIKLPAQDIEFKISDIGFSNEFFGELGHFAMIDQNSSAESIKMSHVDPETGSVIREEFTVPERFKAVFDSYGVEYNKEALEADIARVAEKMVHIREMEASQNK